MGRFLESAPGGGMQVKVMQSGNTLVEYKERSLALGTHPGWGSHATTTQGSGTEYW